MKIPPKLRSVRSILTFWYSAILLAAFAVFGFSVYLYLEHLQQSTLERDLLEEVDWISRIIDLEKESLNGITIDQLSRDLERRIVEHFVANPRNYLVAISTLHGRVLYESETGQEYLYQSAIPQGTTILGTSQDRQRGSLRLAVRRDDPFIVQVAYPERALGAVLEYLLSIFAVLVPVVLFLSIAGGWVMSGMALRPVSQISQLANSITAENLNERIPARAVEDELGVLINTINKMIARLQSSFDQIREFSFSVAHELKTPLTIMKGESELALAKPLSADETERLITTYLEETVRMSHIVDDLLTLAKADAGQIHIRKEPVAIDELVNEVYDDASILSTDKHLTVTLDRNDPRVINGDPIRLRQLLRAVVTNAIRYTEPGGRIHLRCSHEGSHVIIEVEDTGIGIAPEHVEKIFQKFYRVDDARTRAKGGSGLGLSIAKWIIDAHNGTIAVRSTPGKGSCFSIRLPISR